MTDYCARCGRWCSLCRCAGDQVSASRRGEPCNIGDTPHIIGRCDYFHEDVEMLELREMLRRVVMDYTPDDCPPDCQCSAAAARRYLAEHDSL